MNDTDKCFVDLEMVRHSLVNLLLVTLCVVSLFGLFGAFGC